MAGLGACLCSVPVFLYVMIGGGFSRMHAGYFLWHADIFVFSLAVFGMTMRYGENPGRTDQHVDERAAWDASQSW
jgi:hypothetical protein